MGILFNFKLWFVMVCGLVVILIIIIMVWLVC